MLAANTVLENGARVVLLEKSSFCGDNSSKATSSINGSNTRITTLSYTEVTGNIEPNQVYSPNPSLVAWPVTTTGSVEGIQIFVKTLTGKTITLARSSASHRARAAGEVVATGHSLSATHRSKHRASPWRSSPDIMNVVSSVPFTSESLRSRCCCCCCRCFLPTFFLPTFFVPFSCRRARSGSGSRS